MAPLIGRAFRPEFDQAAAKDSTSANGTTGPAAAFLPYPSPQVERPVDPPNAVGARMGRAASLSAVAVGRRNSSSSQRQCPPPIVDRGCQPSGPPRRGERRSLLCAEPRWNSPRLWTCRQVAASLASTACLL